MKKLDARKTSRNAMEEIRKRAVLQVESGESSEAVIKALGMHRNCIYEWLGLYREGRSPDALQNSMVHKCKSSTAILRALTHFS